MNLSITLEYRFSRTPDGAVWTNTSFSHTFWQRYLDVFSHVNVIARTQDVNTVPSDHKRADGDGVTFSPLPYYVGPVQYLRHRGKLRHAMRQALQTPSALIMRVPSQIALIGGAVLQQPSERPFGLEVVGDPYDVFASGAVRHPLRRYFRWSFARNLRRQCAEACATAYVTAEALQRRYPPAPDTFTTHYSSIELGDNAFVSKARRFDQTPAPVRLVMVGSLEQMYKAPDVLIDAVADCIQRGLDLHLTIVGDGKYRPELEAQARALGIRDRIVFAGMLPAGAAVRAELDQADVFILPSRTEGLPRAMIEAMARGLPCIGSTAGGIPELIPPQDMVPPGDVKALADKIAEVVTNPARMTATALRNLERSQRYHEAILRERRIAFYTYVKDATREWLSKHGHQTLPVGSEREQS